MNIGFLFHGYKGVAITGINRVIYETMEELLKIENCNQYYSLGSNYFDFPIEERHGIPVSRYDEKSSYILDLYCRCKRIELVFSFYRPLPVLKGKYKGIIMVHDLIPLLHPEWFGKNDFNLMNNYIRKSVETSDAVIAVSEATKRDVVQIMEVPDDKVRVLYSGVRRNQLSFSNADAILEKYLITERYVLSVCTLEPRKNLRGLIQAFLLYKQRHRDDNLKLVLVGMKGWDYAFGEFLNSLDKKYQKDIILTGYINEEELSALYYGALGFAYVSFYEGFGLPILEAMQFGKAVLTSNTSSMPEVGGDAVYYCDPYDVESICSSLEEMITNDQGRKEMEEKAIARAKLFSYQKTAQGLLQIFNEVMEG